MSKRDFTEPCVVLAIRRNIEYSEHATFSNERKKCACDFTETRVDETRRREFETRLYLRKCSFLKVGLSLLSSRAFSETNIQGVEVEVQKVLRVPIKFPQK